MRLDSKRRVPLHGSAPRHPLTTKFHPASINPADILDVTIVIRPRCSAATVTRMARRLVRVPPAERRYLTHDEFVATVGAADADLKRVAAFARQFGLRVTEMSSARWCVTVNGTVKQMARAFAVQFRYREHPDAGMYRTHVDAVNLPVDIARVVVAVIGLDSPPFVPLPHRTFKERPRARGPVSPGSVASFYEFPRHAKGRRQTIGIIELGGSFAKADVRKALHGRLPKMSIVPVDGQQNTGFDPAELRREWRELTGGVHVGPAEAKRLGAAAGNVLAIVETTLDIELAAALAPEARLVIYFAPATFHGKYHAFTQAIADHVHSPDVVSCSFGLREDLVTSGYARAINFALQAASLKGITFCVATGDAGSGPEAGRPPIVQFPASSPFVLACGGTTVHLQAMRERVWQEITFGRFMASGGGFSRLNRRPPWAAAAQRRFRNKGRGVPDVAAKADVNGGYRMVVAGMTMGMGGTSAAAPLWAALVARLNEELGTRVGWLTPWLYNAAVRPGVRAVRTGSTGLYRADGRGWDPCTGLGTPRGDTLLRLLRPSRNSPTDVSW